MIYRSFTTAATQAVKVPLTVYGVEGRYATAIYTAAVKSQSLDKVASELTKLSSAVTRQPALQQFLDDPTQKRTDKQRIVQQLLTQEKYSALVIQSFSLLAENGRLPLTQQVIKSFQQIMKAHRGEIDVVVTSAKELEEKYKSSLTQLIASKFVPAGKTPKVSTKVDASLLGGLIIEVGDKTVDMSVASKLNRINKSLDEQL